MARGERLLEHALALRRVARQHARDPHVAGDRVEPRRALGQRHVEQVVAVEVQHVEEERPIPSGGACAVDARDRVLERGRAVVAHPDRLAVEHRLLHRQPPHGAAIPGSAAVMSLRLRV